MIRSIILYSAVWTFFVCSRLSTRWRWSSKDAFHQKKKSAHFLQTTSSCWTRDTSYLDRKDRLWAQIGNWKTLKIKQNCHVEVPVAYVKWFVLIISSKASPRLRWMKWYNFVVAPCEESGKNSFSVRGTKEAPFSLRGTLFLFLIAGKPTIGVFMRAIHCKFLITDVFLFYFF